MKIKNILVAVTLAMAGTVTTSAHATAAIVPATDLAFSEQASILDLSDMKAVDLQEEVAPALQMVNASAQIRASALASCSTGRIESVASNLKIRYQPDIGSSAITIAQRGWQYDCWWFDPNGYILGGRYTACGVSDGNGWIGVAFYQPDGTILIGYTYQACVKDI